MGQWMMELIRGDIILVNFNPAKGGEIGKLRPAIVMSDKEKLSILSLEELETIQNALCQIIR